jgi:hypothetical protein
VALGPGFPEVEADAKPAAPVGPGFPEVAAATKPAAPGLNLGEAVVFKSSFAFLVSIWFSMSDDGFLFCFEEPQAEINVVSSQGLNTGRRLRPLPPLHTKNHLNEEITPLLPTGIGERFSQTISNLGHAALLRRCEIPILTKVLN